MARCHPWKGRRSPVRCACRHGRMMTAFDCATEAWLDMAEAVTSMYAAELAEFKASNPPPHLADYMPGVF